MDILTEKFQVTLPGKIEDGEGWASLKSQRKIAPEAAQGRMDMGKMNQMPVGYDAMPSDHFAQAVAGQNDMSNKRMGLNSEKSYREGYAKGSMKMIDDQEFMEHVDHFYGDAGGFVERNNLLDRQ